MGAVLTTCGRDLAVIGAGSGRRVVCQPFRVSAPAPRGPFVVSASAPGRPFRVPAPAADRLP